MNGIVRLKHNIGFNSYWKYSTKVIKTPSTDIAFNVFCSELIEELPNIKEVVKKHNGEAFIRAIIHSNKDDAIAFHFGKDILKLAMELNSEIDIDTYTNN